MKKMFMIIIVILGGLQLWAQGSPIKPLKENGYSLDEVKIFIQGHSELSINFRKEMLKIIQGGLSEEGESLVLDEKNFPFILERIQYKNIQLNSGYTNSRRVGNKIQFFSNKKGFIGEVGIFIFGKTKIVLFKTICLNLLKVEQRDIFITKKDKDFSLIKKEQTIVKRDSSITIINNYYYGSDKKTLTKTQESKPDPVIVRKTETVKYVPVYYPTTRYVGYRNYGYGGYGYGGYGYGSSFLGSIIYGLGESILYRSSYYNNYSIYGRSIYRNYNRSYNRNTRKKGGH